MKLTRLAMLAILFVAVAETIPAAPRSSSSNAIAAEAGAAYDAKDWPKAAKLYTELSQSPQAPPRVWLRLGASLRELGKYQAALAALEKANASGAALFGEYGEAAVYAAMKQPDKALEHLEKPCNKGMRNQTC